jgi:hypothetical protein
MTSNSPPKNFRLAVVGFNYGERIYMQMRGKSSQFKLIATSVAICSVLTGCSGDQSAKRIEQLEEKVRQLETENTSLKSQAALWKEGFVADKERQLKGVFGKDSAEGAMPTDATMLSGIREQTKAAATAQGLTPESQNDTSSVKEFTDIADSATKSMIEDLHKLGVFGNAAQFRPDDQISRAEYAEWLFKAHNALMPAEKQVRLAAGEEQKFSDVPPSVPQYKYIQALAAAGYSIGYTDGTFRPDKPLTREEMLGMKVGMDVGKDLDPWRSQMEAVWKFSDAKSVDERFTGYVHQDYYVSGPKGSNIQRAFGKLGSFKPKKSVLRSEAAATLWQFGQFGDRDQTFASAVLKNKAT